jgi:hypothetical protein
VLLAARGTRNLDEGEETIEDRGLADALRRRARGIWIRSLVLALGLTLIPWLAAR